MNIRKLPAVIAGVMTLIPLVVGPGALAETVNLDGVPIDLPIPDGYCSLTTSNSSDDLLIKTLEAGNAGQNQVMLVFADCDKLEALRQGLPESYHVGAWLAQLDPTTQKPLKIQDISPQIYIDQVTRVLSGGDNSPKPADTLDQRLDAIAAAFNNTATPLQVLVTGSDALYFAILVSDGGDSKIAGVAGLTTVQGYSVSVNMYRPYKVAQDFKDLYALANQSISKTNAGGAYVQGLEPDTTTTPASPPAVSQPVVEPIDISSTGNNNWLWGLVIGAVIGGVIGAIVYVVKKKGKTAA